MNIERVEEAVKVILEEIEKPREEGLVETPNRVARMYGEICSALHTPPPDLKVFTNEEEYNQMIIVKEFPSLFMRTPFSNLLWESVSRLYSKWEVCRFK